jgi:diguanylate cyclase (GGDEF)-like protein
MTKSMDEMPDGPALSARAAEYFEYSYNELASHVDRMFVCLLAAEWIGAIAAAWFVAPRIWNGAHGSVHPHLWAAILAGPTFILPTICLALIYPGRQATRHAVAVAQILVSVLLIDVTGGRIETHFHIFGSLAFLAFYRDWRVLITASVLTAIDHAVRGIWWPQSVYGVLTVSPWRWVEHAGWVIFEDIFLILGGIRSRKEMWAVAFTKAQLHAGAYHDVLTGLANRRHLKERFDLGLRPDSNCTRAVLFVDLDRFKQANDTLGHTIGDKLLTLVGERLTGAVSVEHMLARIGGDEFVVLLDRISGLEDAMATGARLLSALSTPFDIEGHDLLLSASIGISLYPEHGTDLATLQERADGAMYVAKSRGRNQCAVFSSEVAQRESILKQIGRDLYKALANAQIQLHFQPLFDRDARLLGFEALARWMHPLHGEISPTEFIPLAERSGQIVRIGEWILREACRNCVSWQINGQRPVGVAVNVSTVQFEQPDFPQQVAAILREVGLEPSLLTLELTESVLLRDVARAHEQLTGLRESGVRIALDDFGTGYSSLSYLSVLPADTIKLDRSFVHREFTTASAVMESVIEMAHRVGLQVVGEGVETQTQHDRLYNMNCDQLQGFYFSPPMPANAVERYIESRSGELTVVPEVASHDSGEAESLDQLQAALVDPPLTVLHH